MSEPYLGEIRLVSFAFAPRGWALCNGQLLQINQNQALFAILGTTYGGNGTTNFALPNLQGAVPMHFDLNSTPLGQSAGEELHSLAAFEMPAHSHGLLASADFANTAIPGGAVPAAKPRGGQNIYAPPGSPATPMHPAAIAVTGGNQPHENRQPYLTMNFIMAMAGIFPSRN